MPDVASLHWKDQFFAVSVGDLVLDHGQVPVAHGDAQVLKGLNVLEDLFGVPVAAPAHKGLVAPHIGSRLVHFAILPSGRVEGNGVGEGLDKGGGPGRHHHVGLGQNHHVGRGVLPSPQTLRTGIHHLARLSKQHPILGAFLFWQLENLDPLTDPALPQQGNKARSVGCDVEQGGFRGGWLGGGNVCQQPIRNVADPFGNVGNAPILAGKVSRFAVATTNVYTPNRVLIKAVFLDKVLHLGSETEPFLERLVQLHIVGNLVVVSAASAHIILESTIVIVVLSSLSFVLGKRVVAPSD